MRPYPILISLSDVKPFGGAEHFVAQLAANLDRALFVPRVLVPREAAVVDTMRGAGIPVHVFPLTRARDAANMARYYALLKKHGIRLVNSHGVRGGLYAGLARAVLPVKVVVCEHNLQPWRARRLPRALDRIIARHNDLRVGVSRTIVDDMLAAGVVTRERVRAIPAGVDVKRFAPDRARRERARRRLGIDDNEQVVVSAGRLHRMKGFIDLVDAMPRVVQHVPGTRLMIAGEGEERITLEKRIAALNLGDAIHLAGFVRDIPEFLAAADVFVLPSVALDNTQQEGTPVAILEAGAAGLPVVTTRVSGNAEIIRDGFNGRVVEPGDPTQLADTIIDVLRGSERGRMGENAIRVVRERYSLERVVEAYTEIFLSLLEPGGST